MERIFILASLLCIQFAFAESPRPVEPKGWVALESQDPILLSWTKPNIDKTLKGSPNFSVQKFSRSEKFEKFVKEKSLDKDQCRDLKDGGWNQTWCLREKSILVILSKNEDSESPSIKKILRAWVLTHE